MPAVWMGGSTRTYTVPGGGPVAVGLEQAPCAGDGHRHHRRAGLDRNAEGTGLELTGAALFALVAGAFREG